MEKITRNNPRRDDKLVELKKKEIKKLEKYQEEIKEQKLRVFMLISIELRFISGKNQLNYN